MKTIEEIKDEYANERGRDSWEQYFQWLTLCHTDHDTMQYIHDKVLSIYAKQYIDRVKEFEDALIEYVEVCKQGGVLNVMYFEDEFKKLLNK